MLVMFKKTNLRLEVKDIFCGYPFGKKGLKVYDIEARDMFVSHDVIFCEEIFPFATQSNREKSFG